MHEIGEKKHISLLRNKSVFHSELFVFWSQPPDQPKAPVAGLGKFGRDWGRDWS